MMGYAAVWMYRESTSMKRATSVKDTDLAG